MINELKIQELLFTYVDLILVCEGHIKKAYNLQSIPYLNKDKIPKREHLQFDNETLEYDFHGSGCTFKFGPIEINYDIYLDRENYIVTSAYKFTTFINSYLDSDSKITESQISIMLKKLEDKRIINKIYENYFVYEINFEWYNAVKNKKMLLNN